MYHIWYNRTERLWKSGLFIWATMMFRTIPEFQFSSKQLFSFIFFNIQHCSHNILIRYTSDDQFMSLICAVCSWYWCVMISKKSFHKYECISQIYSAYIKVLVWILTYFLRIMLSYVLTRIYQIQKLEIQMKK